MSEDDIYVVLIGIICIIIGLIRYKFPEKVAKLRKNLYDEIKYKDATFSEEHIEGIRYSSRIFFLLGVILLFFGLLV